jgi:Cu-Zn family superoxide dismutase
MDGMGTAPTGVKEDPMSRKTGLLCALLALAGCSHQTGRTRGGGPQERAAEGSFVTAPGVTLEGEAELKEVPGGVQVQVALEDAPEGRKGVHIQQKGDCSDVPGKSMGEHFTVLDPEHGLPTDSHHHLGDLGNIDVTSQGEGRLVILVPGANLSPADGRSFAGKAVVIHESEDVGTGPSGDSGKPIACAVISPK